MKIRISIQNGFCVASWLVADSQAPLHSQVLQFLLLLSGCLRETGCFPGGSDGKESACNSGHLGSIPGSGGSPGEGSGNPLQYSCLRNSVDRGAVCSPWGCEELDTTEQLTLPQMGTLGNFLRKWPHCQ